MFWVPLLKLNIRNKDTLISKGLLRDLNKLYGGVFRSLLLPIASLAPTFRLSHIVPLSFRNLSRLSLRIPYYNYTTVYPEILTITILLQYTPKPYDNCSGSHMRPPVSFGKTWAKGVRLLEFWTVVSALSHRDPSGGRGRGGRGLNAPTKDLIGRI